MQWHRYEGKDDGASDGIIRRSLCVTKSTKFFVLHRRKFKYLHINVYFSTSIFSMCLCLSCVPAFCLFILMSFRHSSFSMQNIRKHTQNKMKQSQKLL